MLSDMNFKKLTILSLVFLMSGVVGFIFPDVTLANKNFSYSRQKLMRESRDNAKRLQRIKKIRQKQHGSKSVDSKIKIRFSSGGVKFDKGSASSSSIHFTWESFGVGQSEFFYGKDYNSDYSFRFKPIIFNEMSYSFGNNNNYTLGFGNIKSGDVGIYISESNEDFRANTIKGNSSFFLYSYNLSFFEILFGYRYIRVEASDFFTFTPSTVSEKYIIEGGHSIFGIGLIF